MKRLLLALLLQLARPSMQSNSKRQIRLEIIVSATFNGNSHEKELKGALLMLTEKFEIDQQYTRIALLDYDGIVTRRTSLTDNHDQVVRTIKRIEKRAEQPRSQLYKALEEMLEISKTDGRADALKMFIVITHRLPTKGLNDEKDFTEGVPVSKEINAAGLFFIVYDYTYMPDMPVMAYFRKLCGKDNLFTLGDLEGINKVIETKIIPRVLSRACEQSERLCYFADSSRKTCQSIWHYPDGYLASEDCRETQNVESPKDCQLNECNQMCDKYWPWQQDPSKCDCGVQIGRLGEMPFGELTDCEKVLECTICNHTIAIVTKYPTVTKNDTGTAKQKGKSKSRRRRVPKWAVGLIGLIAVWAAGVIVFVVLAAVGLIPWGSQDSIGSTVADGSMRNKALTVPVGKV